ncbi:MAG: cyanophycin synthetase [Actinomycetota bacterium]
MRSCCYLGQSFTTSWGSRSNGISIAGTRVSSIRRLWATPDAVARVLATCQEITSGKVIAVLGCGGNRDAGKRPLMGEALFNGSDISIFTSDNPRDEDPDEILKQMVGALPSIHQRG